MLLKEVEGHSVEELASMTGMNENTIKVKLFPGAPEAAQSGSTLVFAPPDQLEPSKLVVQSGVLHKNRRFDLLELHGQQGF